MGEEERGYNGFSSDRGEVKGGERNEGQEGRPEHCTHSSPLVSYSALKATTGGKGVSPTLRGFPHLPWPGHSPPPPPPPFYTAVLEEID